MVLAIIKGGHLYNFVLYNGGRSVHSTINIFINFFLFEVTNTYQKKPIIIEEGVVGTSGMLIQLVISCGFSFD